MGRRRDGVLGLQEEQSHFPREGPQGTCAGLIPTRGLGPGPRPSVPASPGPPARGPGHSILHATVPPSGQGCWSFHTSRLDVSSPSLLRRGAGPEETSSAPSTRGR